MAEDREQRLGKFFEDALNQTINEYLREIKDDFIKRYDLNRITEHELDFLVVEHEFKEEESGGFESFDL